MLFICIVLAWSGMIIAQEQKNELLEPAERRLAERGEVIIRFVRPADKGLDYLTTFLSIDNVRHDTVTAYANADGFRQFVAESIPYSLLQPPSLKNGIFKPFMAAGDWHNQYPAYSGYVSLMDSFALNYPSLCRLVEIGHSEDGHKLLVMKVTDQPETRENEPVVLLSSTIHGDEPLGFLLMLRLIDELLTHYESDDQIKRLVDSVEIWINPLANPDGTYFISDNSVAGATRFNANQVDLNRNFPDPNGDEHPDLNSWQVETIAMMNFMKSIPLVLAANFHGGTEVVNYPWDTFPFLHPDDSWYRQISHAYADTTRNYGPPGYMSALDNGITNGYQWYPVHGGRQDYVNYFLHGREVTIELSYDKIPEESSLNDYWNYNRKSLLQYIGQVLTGVTGKVTDSVTGLPVKAMISIPNHDQENSHVYSDAADGNYYRLTGEGNYVFNIYASGYHNKQVPVRVSAGQLTRLDASLSPAEEFLLYPNPFSDILFVNIMNPGDELVLEFSDLWGRKVKRIAYPVMISGKQEIRVNALASGIYIVNISYGEQITRQVIVRK